MSINKPEVATIVFYVINNGQDPMSVKVELADDESNPAGLAFTAVAQSGDGQATSSNFSNWTCLSTKFLRKPCGGGAGSLAESDGVGRTRVGVGRHQHTFGLCGA